MVNCEEPTPMRRVLKHRKDSKKNKENPFLDENPMSSVCCLMSDFPDYMHFRYYASTMGRFLKPDSLIPNPANPQSWNLYSYVNGNPVNFNDPSGHAMGSRPQFAYMQGTHSFGMSWFDQFNWHSPDWSPWPGQTADNSWYYGSTRSAMGYYAEQYRQSQTGKKSEIDTDIGQGQIIRVGLFSKAVDIAEIGKLLLEGGLIYAEVGTIQLAKDMMALIRGLLIEMVGDSSILNQGLQAWNSILQTASKGTPFNADQITREAIQDSSYEIYRISQEEGLTFKQMWKEYGMLWAGSDRGEMATGFLEWYRKRFI
jgi:RHS repeat-associated protein